MKSYFKALGVVMALGFSAGSANAAPPPHPDTRVHGLVKAAASRSWYATRNNSYNGILKSVLQRDIIFDEGSIRIWRKKDPRQNVQEDLSDVQEMIARSSKAISLEEIGVYEKSSLGGIYIGPLMVRYSGREFGFVVTRTDLTWGYDHDRCFLIYQDLKYLDTTAKPRLISFSCKDAEKIKKNAVVSPVAGYYPLDTAGKSWLTNLSNQKWSKSVTVTSTWNPSTTGTVKESFQFSFWDDFKKFDYTAKLERPSGYHSVGPYEGQGSMPQITDLGMRSPSPGIREVLIRADEPWFMSQSARSMSFPHAVPAVWESKTSEDLDKAADTNVPFYCYLGFDCKVFNPWGFKHIDQELDATYIVLRHDEAKPEELQVQYHLVDPRFPNGVVTTYQAEE